MEFNGLIYVPKFSSQSQRCAQWSRSGSTCRSPDQSPQFGSRSRPKSFPVVDSECAKNSLFPPSWKPLVSLTALSVSSPFPGSRDQLPAWPFPVKPSSFPVTSFPVAQYRTCLGDCAPDNLIDPSRRNPNPRTPGPSCQSWPRVVGSPRQSPGRCSRFESRSAVSRSRSHPAEKNRDRRMVAAPDSSSSSFPPS